MSAASHSQRQRVMAQELRRSLDSAAVERGREPMGLLGKYLYEGDGVNRWRDFAARPLNYVPREATRLVVEQSAALVDGAPRGCQVCLLGAATEEALAFVGALHDPRHVHVVDIALPYAQEVAIALSERFDVAATPHVLDYFSEHLPTKHSSGPTITLFPSSNVSNIPVAVGKPARQSARATQQLARFREQTDLLAVVFDSNLDGANLEEVYNGPAYAALAVGLDSIREVAPTFDVSALEPAQYWDDSARTFVHRVRNTRKQQIEILGESATIAAGQLIYPMHSYKFGPGDLSSVMGQAGWDAKPVSRAVDWGGRLVAELYAQPTE